MNYPIPHQPMHNFEAAKRLFGQFSGEKVGRIAANTAMIGGFMLAAYQFAPHDSPSEKHNKAVYACADQWPEAQTLVASDLPEACMPFRYEIGEYSGETQVTGSTILDMPSADEFVSDNTLGYEYDEDARQANMYRAAGLYCAGLAGYGVIGFRRRLHEVDVERELMQMLERSE